MLQIHENLKVWMTHSRDIQHRLGACETSSMILQSPFVFAALQALNNFA